MICTGVARHYPDCICTSLQAVPLRMTTLGSAPQLCDNTSSLQCHIRHAAGLQRRAYLKSTARCCEEGERDIRASDDWQLQSRMAQGRRWCSLGEHACEPNDRMRAPENAAVTSQLTCLYHSSTDCACKTH